MCVCVCVGGCRPHMSLVVVWAVFYHSPLSSLGLKLLTTLYGLTAVLVLGTYTSLSIYFSNLSATPIYNYSRGKLDDHTMTSV